MSDKTKTIYTGMSFGSALFLLFLGLRLTDHIDWPWYWVAAPLWVGPAAILAICAVVLLGIGIVMAVGYPIAALLDARRARQRRAAAQHRTAVRK
jgi:hypothetical protein